MAQQQYVVLTMKKTVATDIGMLGADPASTAAETMKVHVEPLTEPERADLRRDPRVRAIAAAMPLRLISPMNGVPPVAPAAAGVAWGVEAVGATTSPFDGSGIRVAVLDTGIDPNHAAFAGVNLLQRNFTTGGPNDEHGHGTHCAGTIFGKDSGGLRIGIARNVEKAMIGKVLGPGGGSSATLANAIEWAVAEGANVISMSLGIDFPGFVDFLINDQGMKAAPATSMALEQYRANVNLFSALSAAVEARSLLGQGCIIVAASGNESERPSFEIAVAPPAAGNGVLAVGALQQTAAGLAVASFSNNQVDVAAPGVNITSAKPGGGFTAMSGTSMATPHVAGVAALWAQKLRDQIGRIESPTLLAQLVAKAITAPLAPGFQEDDVGTGVVQAPVN